MNINMDRLNESNKANGDQTPDLDGGCEREEFINKQDSTIVPLDDHHSLSGKDPENNKCRRWIRNNGKCSVCLAIAIATIIVLAAVLVHKKCDNDIYHNANVSTAENYTEPSKLTILIQEDNNKCSIKIPANTSRLEGQSCFNEPQNCYPCNGTCLGADAMREEINKHITCNNSQPYIDCCVVLSVSGKGQCGNHGDLVCIKYTSPPVCQCQLGWTGPFCNETYLVKALCKCDISNQTIADGNAVPNCSSVGRPKDWHFCLHVSSNGTKCICANYKFGFFKDEKALAADCFNDRPHKHYVHP